MKVADNNAKNIFPCKYFYSKKIRCRLPSFGRGVDRELSRGRRPLPSQGPSAVQSALDEFSSLGRTGFHVRYGFGNSRDFLVRNPANGELCDSKAIVGAACGFQYPGEGPLKPSDFSGGEATVAPKLQSLGFEVVRIGEDWSQQEVDATVAAYFEMLLLEDAT